MGYNREKSQDDKQFFFQWNPQRRTFVFRSIPQWKIFSSIVGYNGRGFFPFWDTMEEVFFRCGIQWKKIIQRSMIFLNFKCLSLPSNENLGKICYLNSQTNPWKEVKVVNYMVHHEKTFFFHCGIQRSRDFLIFELK